MLKRDGAVLFCEDGYYKDILYESGSYVYTMEAPDGSVDGETVTIAAKKVCAPPRLAVRYLSEPAALGGTLYLREDPQAVLCADAPAGIRKMEYEGEEGIFRTLEDFETESFCVYGENASAEAVLGETEAFRELHAEGEHLLFDLLGVGEILYDALPSISHRYRHFSSLHDPAPHRGRDFQISD